MIGNADGVDDIHVDSEEDKKSAAAWEKEKYALVEHWRRWTCATNRLGQTNDEHMNTIEQMLNLLHLNYFNKEVFSVEYYAYFRMYMLPENMAHYD